MGKFGGIEVCKFRSTATSLSKAMILVLGVCCCCQVPEATGMTTADTQGNIQGETGSHCKELSMNEYKDVEKNLLLETIKYTFDAVQYEFNLVEELAKDNRWEKVAEVSEIDPQTIRTHFKETREELLESSHKLFSMIYEQGYKNRLDWDAYIEGFTKNKELTHTINDLKDMLNCLNINRTATAAVKLQHFTFLECKGSTLNLVEAMAGEWRSIAREFGIEEDSIFRESNIPIQCAAKVLNLFYEFALTWKQIIDIVDQAGLPLLAQRITSAIKNYCTVLPA